MAKAISFFAGAGGLDTGIKSAGFDIRLTVEIEGTYCETLRLNHPEANIVKGDIMNYDKEKLYRDARLQPDEEIDLIFGGSPCQSFSTAGKRKAFSDPRGKAMLKFAELVTNTQPKIFLLENVKGLLSAALRHRPTEQRGEGFQPLEPDEMPGSAIDYLLKQFKGYDVKYEVINAADFGVPQTRERVFLIGIRTDLDIEHEFPTATHSQEGGKGKKKWVTFGQLLQTLIVDKHHYVGYSEDRLEYMKMIPRGGGNWRDLPENIIKSAMGGAYNSGGGKVGFFRRISLDKPAPTMLTSPIQKSTNLGHPLEDRPLSIEEYLLIQEFPLDYRISGSLTQQYVQIGNAVPVGLAFQFGKVIMNLLKKIKSEQQLEFIFEDVATTISIN
ncbi:DNA cytosine methyltransferase [Brevibacillus sp. NPDC003359]|uniref:DNA cytosine methyltransferase n=1 Tax=unclassified Brevibacillus TaxID=2684853 RepID=UPI0036B927A6